LQYDLLCGQLAKVLHELLLPRPVWLLHRRRRVRVRVAAAARLVVRGRSRGRGGDDDSTAVTPVVVVMGAKAVGRGRHSEAGSAERKVVGIDKMRAGRKML
jgi:hypothetical protein